MASENIKLIWIYRVKILAEEKITLKALTYSGALKYHPKACRFLIICYCSFIQPDKLNYF